jgi:hypothetical protein
VISRNNTNNGVLRTAFDIHEIHRRILHDECRRVGGGRDEGMRGMREDSRVRRRLGSKKLGKLTFRLRAKTGKRADMFSLV